MPNYVVIYHMHTDWALTGSEDRTAMQSFGDPDEARKYMRSMMDAFSECSEIHLYEYTGIQYVLIERMVR